MENKKEFTIEELREMLRAKEQEEAEKKKAEEEAKAKKLAAEKETRKKEIEEVEKKLNELYKNYLKDYGTIAIKCSSDDYNFFTPFWKHFWF